ncbi:hypothetical protein [Mannheimia bovis]|uniref:Uncharacterized protein n=1 Tax=Mannheimia bovis TaxID=2770636 RepID=A0A7H1C3A2_9PAST|nr:hypothetical protein [Mannheimia bovis]QNS15457.1 hypothetical protein ICJ55_01480 [Mannheimia bovis]
MNEIINRATDKKVIAKYKKKKEPKYKLTKKEFDSLESVKVTRIGTFLLFNKDTDTAQFKLNGKFEKIAQFGNVIAISHEKVIAPKVIEIEFEGKKLVLNRSTK